MSRKYSVTARDRLDELANFADIKEIDIIMLSETKLDSNVHPSLCKLHHFQNPCLKHRNRHGGGVAVYHRNTISSKRVQNLKLENECIWIQIKVQTYIIQDCCIYFPPNSNSEIVDDFINQLSESVTLAKAYNPSATFILGDFNTGNIYLNSHSQYGHSGITTFGVKLKDGLDSLNLEQLIDEPTRQTDSVAFSFSFHFIKVGGPPQQGDWGRFVFSWFSQFSVSFVFVSLFLFCFFCLFFLFPIGSFFLLSLLFLCLCFLFCFRFLALSHPLFSFVMFRPSHLLTCFRCDYVLFLIGLVPPSCIVCRANGPSALN